MPLSQPPSLPRSFHPYHPRGTRAGLLLAMVVSLGVLGWALWDVAQGRGTTAWMRTGGALLLLVAFASLWWRLRPRDGWGAQLTVLGLTLSRPFGSGALELEWDQIRALTREGKARDTLVLHLPEGEWRLEARMFARPADFERVVEAIEDRLPRRGFDA